MRRFGIRTLLVAVATVSILAACYPAVPAGGRYVAAVYQPGEITLVDGLVYGQGVNDRGFNINLGIDIHRPPLAAEGRPTLVIVHGGNFIIGGPTVHHPQAADWARRGYVVATPTHRLVATAPDPLLDTGPGLDAAGDIQLAVEWLRANADTFGIDRNRIAVVGISSGGIPALLSGQRTDLTEGRSTGQESHVPNAVFATGTTALPTLVNEGHIRADTAAAPALIHQHELDNVSGSTGDDARFACLVWSSEPSTSRCTPTISPGTGHFIFFTPEDQFSLTQFSAFLTAELDLANAVDP